MTAWRCGLCGATTESVAFVNSKGGVPFCYTPNAPCCYAEASVRHEVTRQRAEVGS
jgi:hypothetical protein